MSIKHPNIKSTLYTVFHPNRIAVFKYREDPEWTVLRGEPWYESYHSSHAEALEAAFKAANRGYKIKPCSEELHHECFCGFNPPCDNCVDCAHWYVEDCPNNCQECDDHWEE